MLESSKAMADYKAEVDKKTKALEAEKTSAEAVSGKSAEAVNHLKRKIEELEGQVGTSSGQLREELKKSTEELSEARLKIGGLETQDKEIRAKPNVLSVECKEAQDKYQQELLLHAKDIEQLNKLKEESFSNKSSLEEVELGKERMESSIAELKKAHTEEEEKLRDELGLLREQVSVIGEENRALLNQLETVSGQLADVSSAAAGPNESPADVSTLDTSAFSNTSLRLAKCYFVVFLNQSIMMKPDFVSEKRMF